MTLLVAGGDKREADTCEVYIISHVASPKPLLQVLSSGETSHKGNTATQNQRCQEISPFIWSCFSRPLFTSTRITPIQQDNKVAWWAMAKHVIPVLCLSDRLTTIFYIVLLARCESASGQTCIIAHVVYPHRCISREIIPLHINSMCS